MDENQVNVERNLANKKASIEVYLPNLLLSYELLSVSLENFPSSLDGTLSELVSVELNHF